MKNIFLLLCSLVTSSAFSQNMDKALRFGSNPQVKIHIGNYSKSISIKIPNNTLLTNHWLNKRMKSDTSFVMTVSSDHFSLKFKNYSVNIPDSLILNNSSSQPISINGKPYRGSFILYKNKTGIEVINLLDIEYYLMSVIPAEIGNGRKPNDYQAVLAQSVAARTFTIDKIINNRSKSIRYDLSASTFDQVYEGINSENPNYTDILQETRGLVAVYNQDLIQALYHSTCGGQTENAESIWGGKPLPYLKSVYCGDESNNFCSISPFYKWERSIMVRGHEKQLKNNLEARKKMDSLDLVFNQNGIQDFKIVRRDSSGRVSELSVYNGKNKLNIKGDFIRWLFTDENKAILPSNWFTFTSSKMPNYVIKSVLFKGRGYGHGLGLCQWGAIGMSRLGYNYEQILKFYYQGIELVRLYP